LQTNRAIGWFFRLWIGRAGGKYSPFLIIMRRRGIRFWKKLNNMCVWYF
jgi:hypothetical protein